jgi:hypothetical protein
LPQLILSVPLLIVSSSKFLNDRNIDLLANPTRQSRFKHVRNLYIPGKHFFVPTRPHYIFRSDSKKATCVTYVSQSEAGRKHTTEEKMQLKAFNTNRTYSSDGEQAPSRPKILKRKFIDTDFNSIQVSSHAAVNRLRAEDLFERENVQDRMPRSLQQAETDMMDIDQEENPVPEDLSLEPRFAIVVSGYNPTVDSQKLVSIFPLSKSSLNKSSHKLDSLPLLSMEVLVIGV